MANFVALLDANVFYPAALRDLLLRIACSDLFKARWTEQIHDEWINALLRERPELKDKLKRTRELINRSVPDCLVSHYQPHIESLKLPDPDDRHVLAAAIQCQAGVIVTMNLKDFPEKTLRPFGMQAQHPDEFISHVFDLNPSVVIAAVREMREALINPKLSIDELLRALLRAGLPNTVSLLEQSKTLL
jgi:predicted nucleic acid-binding protein